MRIIYNNDNDIYLVKKIVTFVPHYIVGNKWDEPRYRKVFMKV